MLLNRYLVLVVEFDQVNPSLSPPEQGQIIFPSVEPFGEYLFELLKKDPSFQNVVYVIEKTHLHKTKPLNIRGHHFFGNGMV